MREVAAEPASGRFLEPGAEPFPRSDGLATVARGRPMMLLTADCLPVAIARADGRRLAVLHAGWRGLEAGIVEAGVEAVGGEVVGAVGPGAGPCCYEVGDDVAARLQARFGADVVRDGRADLWLCARRALEAAGARRVAVAGECSICNPSALLLAPARQRRHRPPGRRGGAACLTRPPSPRTWPGSVPLVGPDVEILAATKYVEADDLPALHAAGVTLVGENRTDSLIPKQERFGDLFTWDFIGHVQSRKVRDIVGRVRLIHAVDSLSACEQLERRRAPGSTVDCLLQVNVAGEDTKSGVAPAEVDAFLESVGPLAGVRFRGLMTMPPAVSDPEHARPWFAALRELRDRLAPAWRGRHEFDPSEHGHEPGLRGGRTGGCDDRAGGWRPLRAVEFSVTWP